MKSLKFRKDLAELIKEGTKNSTWRLFDDKNISKDDKLMLVIWETSQAFGEAIVTKVIEKPLGELTQGDKEGHEEFDSDNHMYDTYSGYYSTKVGPDTPVKIIWFRLV